jgi:hypothetical protein
MSSLPANVIIDTTPGHSNFFIMLDIVVSQDPPTSVDRQHESWEARSLYPSALQLARDLMLGFVGHAT